MWRNSHEKGEKLDSNDGGSGSVGSGEGKLKAGALTLFESAVMGVAGVAPAYSIAATTAALYGAVAFGGPAALLYCGIAMFGIVWAFN